MSLLTLNVVAKQLRRFEIVAGIVYPSAREVAEMWLEHFKEYSSEKFLMVSKTVETHIKWKILPTPGFFLDIEEGPKQ